MTKHSSIPLLLHDTLIPEVDVNMVSLIRELNRNKLITSGCCENNNDEGFAYIIFEYNSYVELVEGNKGLSDFIDSQCI